MKSRELLISLAIKYKGNWEQIYEAIKNKEFIEEEAATKLISEMNSNAVTIIDPDYPEGLKHIHKPPFVLFYLGDLSLIKDIDTTIAVVGSRNFSDYGSKITEYLVKGICQKYTIVSGLARGIDSIAHKAAINNGGKTVAVLGSGINHCFPAQNYELYKKIVETNLVISEYPGNEPAESVNFPIRNRIVAGLSGALLVTEAYEKSGTMITVALCLDQGKPVCVVPYDAFSKSACNYLISEGGYLVQKPQDIFDIVDRVK